MSVRFKQQKGRKGLVIGVGFITMLSANIYMVLYRNRKQRRFQLARVY